MHLLLLAFFTRRELGIWGLSRDTIVRIEQLRPLIKQWPFSWNPPVPHHRIRGKQRSLKRDTERGIKFLQYCEVVQRGGAYKCTDVRPCRAPRVTRTGTYDSGRAPLRGWTGLHLILYSTHSTDTDQRWAMSPSNTPPVRNRTPLTVRSWSLRCVPAEQDSKTGRTKPRKHPEEATSNGTLASRYQVFEKLLWKPSEDSSQRSSWNQMSLPI